MQENLELVNQVLSSGFWSVECAQSGNPESVFFSHEFRKMLGYHDTLDFPNNLETWERGIHPRDLEEVSRTFQEAFQDKTNEKNMMWNTACVWRMELISGLRIRER